MKISPVFLVELPPVILHGDEDMPVTVIFDELRGAEIEARNRSGQRHGEKEPVDGNEAQGAEQWHSTGRSVRRAHRPNYYLILMDETPEVNDGGVTSGLPGTFSSNIRIRDRFARF